MNNKNDNLYQQQRESLGAFRFDERVAGVFADMIARSVPGYAQILALLPTLARRFTFPKLHYYDLGCSLGAGMLALAEGLQNLDCTIVGIDNSSAMLDQARPLLDNFAANHTDIKFKPELLLQCSDISEIELQSAAMILMNFTLQFIPIESRDALVEKIYSALVTGGALVLSEKIKFAEQATDSILIDIHHQYKADQGYSALEISQKRDAIENVLIPETLDVHIERLRRAGFSIVTPWVQNLQFISILAIK